MHFLCFFTVLLRLIRFYSQRIEQFGGADERIIIERGCTQIRITGRKAPLQLVFVRTDYPIRSFLPPAVFQRPFNQWQQLLRPGPVAGCQNKTRRSMRDHRHVTTIPGTIPETTTFRNNRTRNRLEVIIHISCKKTEGIHCRFIANRIAEKREKRIGVFRLIIRPDRSKVFAVAARTVHQSTTSRENTFCGVKFAEVKHKIQFGIRSLQHKFGFYGIIKFTAGSKFSPRLRIVGRFLQYSG